MRQAMFKVQLGMALEALQQSAGMGVVEKWESRMKKDDDQVIGGSWMDEEVGASGEGSRVDAGRAAAQ